MARTRAARHENGARYAMSDMNASVRVCGLSNVQQASCGAPHFRGSLTLPATFCKVLQYARFIIDSGVLSHSLGRKVTGNQIRMLLHSGFSAFQVCLSPEHLSPRVTKRS